MPSDTAVIAAVYELQDWLDSFDGLSSLPIAHASITKYSSDISIGEFCLWDSEGDSPDEGQSLVEFCKEAFLNEVRCLMPFVVDASEQT